MYKKSVVLFLLLLFLIEVVLSGIFGVGGNTARAVSKTTIVTFTENADRTPTKTVSLPNATRIISARVTSSTGGTATATLSGTTATVNAAGASVSRYAVDKWDPYKFSKPAVARPDVNYSSTSAVPDTYNYPTDSEGYNDSKGDLPLTSTYKSEFLSEVTLNFRRPSSGWEDCPGGGVCESLADVRDVYEPFTGALYDSNGKKFTSDGVVRYRGGYIIDGYNYVSEPLPGGGYRYYRLLEKYVSNQLYKGEYKGTVYKGGQVQTDPLYAYTVELTYNSNTAPTIVLNALPSEINKTVSSSVYVSGTVSDPEGDALTVTYSAGTATGTLTTVAAGSGTRSYSGYIPTSGFGTGTQSVTVTASDTLLTDSDTKSTTVVTNRGPAITFDTISNPVNKDRDAYFYVAGTVSDPDDDALAVRWSAGGSSGLLMNVSSGSGSRSFSGYIPSSVLSGTTTVTMTANDGYATASASRNTVGYFNSSPNVTVDNINASYNMAAVSSFTVSGYVSDPDGDGVTMSYTFAGKTTTLPTVYPGTTSRYYSFNVPTAGVAEGNYAVRVDVNDGIASDFANTNTSNFFRNTPPTISANPISPASYNLSRTSQVYVSGTVNDAEKDVVTVTYSFAGRTGTLGTYATTGGAATFSGYIPISTSIADGSYQAVLTASDGTASVFANTNSVTLFRNSTPSISMDTITPTLYNTAKTAEISVAGTLTDADVGDPMEVFYTFNGKTGSFGTFTSTGSGVRFSGKLPISTSLPDGNYPITVYGTDGLTNSNTASQTVRLFTNRSPNVTVSTISPVRYSENTGKNTITVSGNVTDLDVGDVLTMRYTIGSKSGVLRTVTSTGGAVAYSGTIVVDSDVSEGSQTVKVTANDTLEDSPTVTSNALTIDKTGPSITITATPTTWTKSNVVLTATASDPSGVSGTNPQTRTVTSNTAASCFTFTDTLGNDNTECRAVTNIDKTAAVLTVARLNDTASFTKTNSAVIDAQSTNDDGTPGGSGLASVEYAWSASSTFSITGATKKTYAAGTNTMKETIPTVAGSTGARYLHVRVTTNVGTIQDVTSPVFNLDNEGPVLGDITPSLLATTSVTLNGAATDSHSGLPGTPYQFYRNGTALGSWTTGYAVTGLTPNTKYDFTFKARDVLANESAVSHVYSVKTLANIPILYAGSKTTTSVGLTVGANSNPAGTEYQIERADDATFATNRKVVRDWSSTLSYTDGTLTSGKTYYYRVRARSVDLDTTSRVTSWSTTLPMVVNADVPILDLSGVTSTSVTVAIDGNGNAAGVKYYMERSTDAGFTSGVVAVLNWVDYKSAHVDGGLLSGTHYYYRMKARNSDGVETVWSNMVNGKTLPATPTLTSVAPSTYSSASVTKSLVVSWADVTGADTYDVYDNATGVKMGTVGAGIGTITITGLNPNVRYDYYVIANNGSGSSLKSNVLGAHTRGHEPLSASVKSTTATTATFTLTNTTIGIAPNHMLAIREKGKTAIVNTPLDTSNKSLEKTLSGLKAGVVYELWVTTTNDAGVSNPELKILDEFFMSRPPVVADRISKVKYSENVGHNTIQLVADVNDLDVSPVADTIKLYYTLRNSAGTAISGHTNVLVKTVTTTGSWQTVTHSIPVDSKIPEGSGYRLDLTAVDGQGSATTIISKPLLVDKSAPKGTLVTTNGPTKDGVTLGLNAVDAAISGKHLTHVKYQVRENNGVFDDVAGWTATEGLAQVNLESLTKFSYRALVRDEVENVLTTNMVEFVTSPVIANQSKYYDDEDTSTIILDWGKSLNVSDGVSVEVRRSGKVFATVTSGTKFVDKSLDYERMYEYDLVAVAKNASGARIESVPVKVFAETGTPLLAIAIYGKYDAISKVYRLNRTMFSDEARVYGDVFYKQGGDVTIEMNDSNGEKSLEFKVHPSQSGKFVMKGSIITEPFETEVTAKLSDQTLAVTPVTKLVSFTIKPPKVVKMSDDKYNSAYTK